MITALRAEQNRYSSLFFRENSLLQSPGGNLSTHCFMAQNPP